MLRIGTCILLLTLCPFAYSQAQPKKKVNRQQFEQLKKLFSLPVEKFQSRFDKDENGTLSEGELPKFLARAFEKWDGNGDGELDRTETTRLMQFMRTRLAQAGKNSPQPAKKVSPKQFGQLKKLFDQSPDQFLAKFDKNGNSALEKGELPKFLGRVFLRVDQNKDGKLDGKETKQLVLAMRERIKKAAGSFQKADARRKLILKQIMKMDKDEDGKIAKKEAQGRLASGFDRVDQNSDGFLDQKEINGLVQRIMAFQQNRTGPGRAPGRVPPDFDALDANADGRLTREELQKTPFAQQFTQMDTNNDDRLTKREFEDHLKKKSNK